MSPIELKILISGDPGTGTTTLTNNLSEELGLPFGFSAGNFGRSLASLWIRCLESDQSGQGGDWHAFESLWIGLYEALLNIEIDNSFKLDPNLTAKDHQLATFFASFNDQASDKQLYDKTLDLCLLRILNGVVEGRVTAHLSEVETWFTTNESKYKPSLHSSKSTIIRLIADPTIAIERLTTREADNNSMEEKIKARKERDWQRYCQLYSIDINTPPPQSFIIDTSDLSISETKLAALFAILTQNPNLFDTINPIILQHLTRRHKFYEETLDALLSACPQISAGIYNWETGNQFKSTSALAPHSTHTSQNTPPA